MSVVKTYSSPAPIVPWEALHYDGPMKPGDWVTHTACGGHGIIVAIDGDTVTVLWSKQPEYPPGFVFAPPVSLQVTPTIFAPEDEFKVSRVARYAKKLLEPALARIKIWDAK